MARACIFIMKVSFFDPNRDFKRQIFKFFLYFRYLFFKSESYRLKETERTRKKLPPLTQARTLKEYIFLLFFHPAPYFKSLFLIFLYFRFFFSNVYLINLKNFPLRIFSQQPDKKLTSCETSIFFCKQIIIFLIQIETSNVIFSVLVLQRLVSQV